MTYPCEIIRDLLPLYIDGVCSDESIQIINRHLFECEVCRKYHEEMKSEEAFEKASINDSEDKKMTDSLKNVKLKINKKTRNIIFGAVSAALVFTVGFQVLFNAPIKSVDKEKVKISAEVYPFSEISHSIKSDDDSVEISLGEEDKSNVYKLEIPGMKDADVTVSEDTMKQNKFATVIIVSSDYFLKNIIWEINGDTMYISSFKTTLLNNKAKAHQKTMTTIEFREINNIVYTDGKTETTLWQR